MFSDSDDDGGSSRPRPFDGDRRKTTYRLYPVYKHFCWKTSRFRNLYLQFMLSESVIDPADLRSAAFSEPWTLVRPLDLDIYQESNLFHQLKHNAKYFPIPEFQPDFDVDEEERLPLLCIEEGETPSSHLCRYVTWSDVCLELYETGSVLFQTLFSNGVSWSMINCAVDLYVSVVYLSHFEFPFEMQPLCGYYAGAKLHEYGFLVLALLLQIYAQKFIDGAGGWTKFRDDSVQQREEQSSQDFSGYPWLQRCHGIKQKLWRDFIFVNHPEPFHLIPLFTPRYIDPAYSPVSPAYRPMSPAYTLMSPTDRSASEDNEDASD